MLGTRGPHSRRQNHRTLTRRTSLHRAIATRHLRAIVRGATAARRTPPVRRATATRPPPRDATLPARRDPPPPPPARHLSRAHAVFRSLDKDLSGEVGYAELTTSIAQEGCSDISLDAKRMLLTLAFTASEIHEAEPQPTAAASPRQRPSSAAAIALAASGVSAAQQQHSPAQPISKSSAQSAPAQSQQQSALALAASRWRLWGHDKEAALTAHEASVRMAKAQKEARKALKAHHGLDAHEEVKVAKRAEAEATKAASEAEAALRVANAEQLRLEFGRQIALGSFMVAEILWHMLDGYDVIDDVQFLRAMMRLFGYKGTPWVLTDVFRNIDSDADGVVNFDELWEWIRGVRHPLVRGRPTRDSSYTSPAYTCMHAAAPSPSPPHTARPPHTATPTALHYFTSILPTDH